MEEYIKLFQNHTLYETYKNSADFITPNVSYCELQDEVHYNPYVHDYSQDYFTFVALESGTFTFTPKSTNKIKYSTDNGTTWTQGNSVAVNSGNKVLWKGTMTPVEYQGIGVFSSTAEFDTQGNIMSLLFGDNFRDKVSLNGKDSAFINLFKDNEKVINSENLTLPATTAVYDCYSSMFEGCTSLVNAPALPATTLEDFCYMGMFKACTSLTSAPELPATTLVDSCYKNMFNGCTSLTKAPSVLPATTLESYCYQNMFKDCTNLTTAPELPATTLRSLCYSYMFYGCTNLNYIKAMFTTTPNISYTDSWVDGVASTGTFVKNSAATWTTTGANGVPTGWTVQTVST